MLHGDRGRAARAPPTGGACARSGTGAAARAPTRRRRAARACPRSRSRRRAGRGRATSPARRSVAHLGLGEAETRAGLGGELGDRARVAEVYGDFRSTKSAIASSAASKRSPARTTASAGSAVDHRVPGADRVEAARGSRPRSARSSVGERRVELLARALARASALRRRDAADAVRHLDELGELGDPRRDRDLLARELARPALAVPPLVRAAERRRAPRRAARAARPSVRAIAACVVDHAVDLAVARDRELEPDAEAVQRRAARAQRAASPVAAARRLRGSWSYLIDFSAMSSPNHFACSWASVWQPTLTSSAV